MPAYVVANIRVHDPVAYEEYRKTVPGTIERFGGRYLARGGRSEVVEGGLEPGRTVIVEFPSYEAAQNWYASAEYATAKVLRQGCADGELLFIDGV